MKHLRYGFFISMALLVVLAACAPQATPTPVVVVVTATTPPTDTPTPAPAATDTPTATPTLSPLDLLPPMEVGSTFYYPNGSWLVAVPGVTYTRGRKGGTDNPEESITISSFWIFRTKVTNQQYKFCVAAGLCSLPNLDDNQGYNDYKRANDPVVGVTYAQAEAYCTSVKARLDTEGEYELYARGPDANLYPWGNGGPSCDKTNYNNCVGSTTNVVKYVLGKSYYGGLDLAGNAFEWVKDHYDAQYYRTGPKVDPPGPDSGVRMSVRSSSYKSNNDQVASAVRFFDDPTHHRRDLSFRCVVEDPLAFAPFCELVMVGDAGPDGLPVPGVASHLDCPTPPHIGDVPYCIPGTDPKTPSKLVSFYDVPAGVTPNQGSCTGSPNPVTCLSETDVSIDWASACTYTSAVPPSCPFGYHQVASSCVPDHGWEGECMPGYNYDPANQCCTAGSGVNSPFDLPPSCPTGFSWNGASCDPIPLPPPVTLHVVMPDCSSTPGQCDQPVGMYCVYGWNQQQCCCKGYNGGCMAP